MVGRERFELPKAGGHLVYSQVHLTALVSAHVSASCSLLIDVSTVNPSWDLKWSGRQDSNLRPHGPKPRTLAN